MERGSERVAVAITRVVGVAGEDKRKRQRDTRERAHSCEAMSI